MLVDKTVHIIKHQCSYDEVEGVIDSYAVVRYGTGRWRSDLSVVQIMLIDMFFNCSS